MHKRYILTPCTVAFSLAFFAHSANAQTAAVSAGGAVPSAAPSEPAKAHDDFFEVGLFTGLLWPASDHAFVTRSHEAFSKPAVLLGARAAYFPLGFLGAEVEGMAATTSTADTDRRAALWALRGHLVAQLPSRSLTPFLLVGGGALGAGSNVTGQDTDKLFHFGGGVKLPVDDFLGLRLDVRDNLTHKYQTESSATHHPEVTLGLTFTLEPVAAKKPEAAPAPTDGDKDGVADEADKCPTEAGDAPDGCPTPKDGDGDGVTDLRDACPNEAGPAPTGCPDRDSDHDCVPLPTDLCPDTPGRAQDGCPDPDADRDGISGAADQCPNQPETVNGFEDGDGCPDTLPEKVKKYSGVVPGIEFDTAQATIRPVSRPVLDDAVAVLKEYPALRVIITGHTDGQGDREKNVALSLNRAEAVKTYLVQHGVDAERIEAHGSGPDQPLADNATAAGRQKNRRIEFKLRQ